MKTNNNRLIGVAKLSLRLARKYLQPYSCPKSPHKFTQPQLMACLIVRAYMKTTYRGVIELLETSDKLRETLGFTELPNYSTLKYFADRSGIPEVVEAMTADLAKHFGRDEETVAVDATGLETTSASAYFQMRRGGRRKKYVKLSLCILCGSMLPAGMVVGWGPSNDKIDARALLDKSRAVVQPKTLLADAGYDAEWVHQYCRDDWKVKSFIPPAVHRADGGANGKYRSQMTPTRLKRNGYGTRWIAESFMSGLKRTTGCMLHARNAPALMVEAAVRVLTYAIRR